MTSNTRIVKLESSTQIVMSEIRIAKKLESHTQAVRSKTRIVELESRTQIVTSKTRIVLHPTDDE